MPLSSKMSQIRWYILSSIMSYVRWWFHDPICHKSDDYFIIQYVTRKVKIFFIQKVTSEMIFCHPLCHKWDDIFFIQNIRSQMMPSLSSILSQVPYVSFSIKYTSTVRVQYVGPILFSTPTKNRLCLLVNSTVLNGTVQYIPCNVGTLAAVWSETCVLVC
jgi:hypothetical protein